MISPASKSEGCPAVVTQFCSGKNEQLPAPKTGGPYKTNRRQRGRSCRELSAPRFSGRRGHISFQTESPPARQIRCQRKVEMSGFLPDRNVPSPPRKTRGGEFSTRPSSLSAIGLVEAARFWGGQLFVFSRTKLSHYGRAPLKYFLRFAAGITVHFAGEAKFEGLL